MTKPIINGVSPLPFINIQQYERYLPTAFDDSLTMLEKMNKLINYLNEIGQITNDVVSQWNSVMEWVMNEGLEDELSKKLDDWKDDGTLASLINGELLDEIKADLEIDMLQSSFSKVVMDMYNGKSVTIDCFGDSTYYGQVSGGSGQVDTPAPEMLEYVLQKYFQNLNITVNNRGVPGNQTTNALRTWETDMQTSKADIVYINYGLNDHSGSNPSGANDPAISAEQFRKNLIQMVEIARKNGKIVIIEAQGLEFSNHSGDFLNRMNGAQQFANVSKQVCEQLNVPFVDQNHFISKYMESKMNIPADFPDGIHPSQSIYIQKGVNMAYPLIRPYEIIGEATIPASAPCFQGEYQNTNNNTGSRTGSLLLSDFGIRAIINVGKSGLDLYGAFVQYGNGSTNVEIKVDGNVIANINTNDPSYVNVYGVDSETMLAQNIGAGLHFIEINNKAGSGRVGLYYLRTYKTRHFPVNYHADDDGTLPSYTISRRQNVLRDIDLVNNGSTNIQIITDIPTSRSLYTLDVEVVAHFNKGDGFMLFTKNDSVQGLPQGGLVIYLNNNTGVLRIAEGKGTAFYNPTDIGTVDLSTDTHRLRVLVTTTGNATFYVDGSNVGQYALTQPHFGGFFGFYKNLEGTSRIDSVSIN